MGALGLLSLLAFIILYQYVLYYLVKLVALRRARQMGLGESLCCTSNY